MRVFKSMTVAATIAALGLSGCITDPSTGQQHMSKTAMYGLGGAVTCGIIGAISHGSKGARNSALACGAIGAGVGGYMDYQEKKLREQLANTGVEVERKGNQIKLTMPENITFATNSAALSAQAQNALSTAAETLAKFIDTTMTVFGHTDSTGNAAANAELSKKRAQAVKAFLEKQGVNAKNIELRKPENTTAAAGNNAQGRRVEVKAEEACGC